jgi:hypothetical protein
MIADATTGIHLALPKVPNVINTTRRVDRLRGSIMSVNPLVLSGAFGGIMPQITRVAGLATAGNGIQSLPPSTPILLFVGALIFYAALGAFMAWVFEETTNRAAFFTGIAAPALLAGYINTATDTHSGPPTAVPSIYNLIPSSFKFVTPARADESDSVQQVIDKILSDKATARSDTSAILTITALTDAASKLVSHVCFMSKENVREYDEAIKAKSEPVLDCLDSEFIQPKRDAFSTLLVPFGAAAVLVNGQLFQLNKPNLSIGIDVAVTPTFKGDLLWALGGKWTQKIDASVRELSTDH